MTREDIIRMAREAGFADGVVDIVGFEGFANFANLVAAHDPFEGIRPLYATPRKWVGLTPEERQECIAWATDLDSTDYSKYLAKMIEYKLKEKNGG
jgi:hypothetical protein